MADPIYSAALDVLDEALVGLRGAVEGASPELLNLRPAGDDTNSIAVIVGHALHSTRSWLGIATGAPTPARDRPAEFRTVAQDTDGFLSLVDTMTADCRSLLRTDGPFDPSRTGVAPWTSEPDAPVTAAWALLHALEHLGEHSAHAQLTRQVLDAR